MVEVPSGVCFCFFFVCQCLSRPMCYCLTPCFGEAVVRVQQPRTAPSVRPLPSAADRGTSSADWSFPLAGAQRTSTTD